MSSAQSRGHGTHAADDWVKSGGKGRMAPSPELNMWRTVTGQVWMASGDSVVFPSQGQG